MVAAMLARSRAEQERELPMERPWKNPSSTALVRLLEATVREVLAAMETPGAMASKIPA